MWILEYAGRFGGVVAGNGSDANLLGLCRTRFRIYGNSKISKCLLSPV